MLRPEDLEDQLTSASRKSEATSLNNIAEIHSTKGDYDKAMLLFQQVYKIDKELGNRKGEGNTLNNIGGIHQAQEDYDKAIILYEQSLKIQQEIGDKHGESFRLNNI